MPFIPFIGLSILIHLMIIFYRSFFMPAERTISKKVPVANWMGVFVVLGVFSFVLSSAVFLVQASVADSHSIINYLASRNYQNKYEIAGLKIKQLENNQVTKLSKNIIK